MNYDCVRDFVGCEKRANDISFRLDLQRFGKKIVDNMAFDKRV